MTMIYLQTRAGVAAWFSRHGGGAIMTDEAAGRADDYADAAVRRLRLPITRRITLFYSSIPAITPLATFRIPTPRHAPHTGDATNMRQRTRSVAT
jgi:hypothetical protein